MSTYFPLQLFSSILTSCYLGIRTPAFNGPIGPGYNSSPVKNLTNIDLRCNLLGDTQATDTITVVPGDTVSFEWYGAPLSTLHSAKQLEAK